MSFEHLNNKTPDIIIVNNFYKDPDAMRNYALNLHYANPEDHGAVGYRSELGRKILDGTKEYFEKLLGRKIKSGPECGGWDYSTNGCLQYGPANTPVVYHSDSQQFAGIIYLTPDAPPTSGTTIYRHKKYKTMDMSIFDKSDWCGDVTNKDFLFIDKRPWEPVDRTGNVYNRLVLFRGSNVHSASEYFGDNVNTSRLYQLFFFDFVEKEESNIGVFEIDNKLATVNNYHQNTSATFKLFKKCFIGDCIRRGFRWEEHQHDVIDKYLDENSVCIEAGGHIGTLAVKLAKTCRMTYSFEPIKHTYDLLKFNMELNCESKRYQLFNKGLGDSNRLENISWISPESACAIGLTNNFFEACDNEICDKDNMAMEIEIITIDSLKLDQLDYLKIDVEGYEEHVINGGINTITKFKPIIILECYESFHPLIQASIHFVQEKYKFLIDMGYKVEHVWMADFLFIYDSDSGPIKPSVPLIVELSDSKK